MAFTVDARDQVVYGEYIEYECIEGMYVVVTSVLQDFHFHSSDLTVHLM